MQFKRGLSDIVTNVLIILIVLVAVGIVWVFISPLFGAPSDQANVDQFTTNFEIPVDSIDVNINAKILTMVVTRKAGQGDVAGILVVLTDDQGNTRTYDEYEDQPIAELESRTIVIDYEYIPTTKPNGLPGNLALVQVAGVFNTPGGTKTGTPTSGIPINPSTGNPGGGNPGPGPSGAVCGNGVVDVGENCDDGNAVTELCTYGVISCSVCTNVCQFGPGISQTCGNGVVDAPHETCEDGNTNNGDGCTSTCQISVPIWQTGTSAFTDAGAFEVGTATNGLRVQADNAPFTSYTIQYVLVSGTWPQGVTMGSDGFLSGAPSPSTPIGTDIQVTVAAIKQDQPAVNNTRTFLYDVTSVGV